MRIAEVRVLPCRLRHLSFIEVQTEEGITGIGSTGSPGHVIQAIVEGEPGGLAELLVGEDPLDVRRLWRRMFQGWQAQRGRGGEGGLAVNAMGAIDMALWDIVGKARGEPVHRLLGGRLTDRVMAYASASSMKYEPDEHGRRLRKSADELAAEAAGAVKQGFKALKFGWGHQFGPEGGEKLAAIREAIGPDVRLMLDFGCPDYWNPGWTARAAVRAIRMAERYDVYFVEEPMPPFDVEGHAAVTRAADLNIATGESLTTIDDFQRYIWRRAVDILQPDAAQMGITQMVDVARSAETAGLLCVPHGPWSALTVASHVHILSTVGNAPMVEHPFFDSYGEGAQRLVTKATHQEIIETPLTLEDGYVRVPDAPGLGLGDYVHEAIARLDAVAQRSEQR